MNSDVSVRQILEKIYESSNKFLIKVVYSRLNVLRDELNKFLSDKNLNKDIVSNKDNEFYFKGRVFSFEVEVCATDRILKVYCNVYDSNLITVYTDVKEIKSSSDINIEFDKWILETALNWLLV